MADASRLRFLIIASPAPSEPDARSLGAACVASAVASDPALGSRVEATVIEASPGESAEELASRAAALRPDVLGLSVFVWNRALLAEAARRIRSSAGLRAVIAGGPEAGAAPAPFREAAGADCVVSGEGEEGTRAALSALLSGASLPRIIEGGACEPAAPWLDGRAAPSSGCRAYWETARGCPFSCAYCYEGRGGKGARPLPLERLERELDAIRESGAEEVVVLDPTFNADKRRALGLIRLIAEKGGDMRFGFEARAEFMDDAICDALAEIPCWTQLGLQSADEAVMAALDRPFDRAAFARGVKRMDRRGLVYGIDLMYGLPGDTLAGFGKSLDFALSLAPNHLDVFRLSVLPGTEIRERAEGLGIAYDRSPPYGVVSVPGFPARDVEAAGALASACDLFYTKGRAVAWFLPVASSLGMEPSALLGAVAAAMARGPHPGLDADPLDILAFQEECLVLVHADRGKKASLEAAKGLARLHAAYAMAVAEGRETGLELSYDPDALLHEAPGGLAAFASSHKASLRTVVVGPDGQGGARID